MDGYRRRDIFSGENNVLGFECANRRKSAQHLNVRFFNVGIDQKNTVRHSSLFLPLAEKSIQHEIWVFKRL